jgi:N-acetylglucosaminyldiphosphoundecaprenol N-acetyl-beta-D-mannosaminyltransferase
MYLRHGDISWDQADGSDAGAVTALGSTTAHGRRPGGPSRSNVRLPSVDLHGVRLHAVRETECIAHLLAELTAGRGGVVVTPNLDHLRRCVRDLHFGALVAEADLVVADGMPLVWASKLQGTPLPERVAGSNLISTLSAAAADADRSIFLLGGAQGTAQGAAEVLVKRHPHIRIVGTHCPQLGFEKKPRQMAEIAQMLAAAQPDIVFVALGSPKQEQLIAKLRPSLPGAWWLGVGVSFSFLTGHVHRAPAWMQRLGIEWAHRLGQEPRRLFKRYIVHGIPFAASLLGRSAYRGVSRRLGGQPMTVMLANSGSAAPNSPAVEVAPNGFLRAAASDHIDIPGTVNERLTQRARRMAATPIHGHGPSLARLKALVLLGGSVRPTPLSTSIGRSLLDLPLDENGSVLNHWLNHAAELARLAGLDKLPVRVMVDRNSPEPISAAVKFYGTFRVERDQSEYRGTGGVLGDLAERYDDDDLILVANAAQILLDPLVSLANTLDGRHGDVGIISHRDGTPSGIMLLKCKTLRLVPKTGFVDMKEQAMPLIAQRFAVEVCHRRRPTGLPIRSVQDYITAMRFYHMRRAGKPTLTDPLAEDWHPSFGIVEEGAVVDPTARVHDSIVLRGGVVEAGAVLVRSVVCPSGLVRRDRTLVDEFVRPVTTGRFAAAAALDDSGTDGDRVA